MNTQMISRIRETRKSRGLTQGDLGRAIDRSAAFISQAERGQKDFSPEMIRRLAASLGVNETWLITGKGSMTAYESTRDRRTIGERLLQVRKERKMNQTDFGAALGVTRLTISQLERNKIAASPKMIAAAVEKFGIDEEWLRSGEKPSEEAEKIIAWLTAHPKDKSVVYNWLTGRF